jgi:ribosomal protein S7
MKKTVLLLSTLAIIFTGCAQNTGTNDNHKVSIKKETPVKPEHSKISDKQLQENIANTMKDDFSVKETQNVKEAVNILAETNNVLQFIAKDKDKKAKEELAKLIGELEILMTRDPNVALIPVNVGYEIKDAVVDIPTVYEITEAAQKAMDDGYYQIAKKLMDDLSSEMIVKTAYLPLATYPDAMRLSAALLEEGKKEAAAAILIKALNTLIIQQQEIPLPVLRAEEFIKLGAEAMNGDEKDKKDVAQLYLDNADYQLQLAEAMGYGKKDKEYKELYDAIKDLKKAITDNKESKGKFEKLSEKIKNFKERLFFKKDSVK